MKTVTGLNRLIEYRELAVSQMVQAFAMAALSPARRRKTGAVIIKQIEGKEWVPLSQGYNGTRTGDSNLCEDIYGKTLPNVIHAEKNISCPVHPRPSCQYLNKTRGSGGIN